MELNIGKANGEFGRPSKTQCLMEGLSEKMEDVSGSFFKMCKFLLMTLLSLPHACSTSLYLKLVSPTTFPS